MAISKKLRERVSGLSTGNANPSFAGGRAPYYNDVAHWHRCLCRILKEGGYEPVGDMPTAHTQVGQGAIWFQSITSPHQEQRVVWFTWYQMIITSHWEIICYVG